MYVIADIEWTSNHAGHKYPTQIAGIKVDSDWNTVTSFHLFIKPARIGGNDWSHMAYTGGTKANFINAGTKEHVVSAFLEWLDDDDTVLWWHPDSNSFFRSLVKKVTKKKKVQQKSIPINNYVHFFLFGQTKVHYDFYRLASKQGISTREELKHFSYNDAHVLRKLLQSISFPQAMFLEPLPNVTLLGDAAKLYAKYSESPYQCDLLSETVHKKGCPELKSNWTFGYDSLQVPLSKGYTPCDCCKTDYRRAHRDSNHDAIEQGNYVYVYTPTSSIYHKPTCKLILSARQIKGTREYDTIARTHRTPCKVCNPSPRDVRAWEKAQLALKPPPQTKADLMAIKRQKIAAAERKRLLSDSTLSEAQIQDVYTLTQPRFAFWVAQGYQTFHLHSCSKLNGLSNLRGFSLYSEAVHAGYTPCRKCRPTAKHDMTVSIPITSQKRAGEKTEVLEQLCHAEGYTHKFSHNIFYIETPVGKWKIYTTTSPIKVDHINLIKTPNSNGYHQQPRLFLSFTDTFEYIKRHDSELERKELRKIV